MALNSSGPISLGGATTGQSINLELGQTSTQTITLNDTNVRTLAGVASGQIVMPTDFWGKSSSSYFIVSALAPATSLNTYQSGGVLDVGDGYLFTFQISSNNPGIVIKTDYSGTVVTNLQGGNYSNLSIFKKYGSSYWVNTPARISTSTYYNATKINSKTNGSFSTGTTTRVAASAAGNLGYDFTSSNKLILVYSVSGNGKFVWWDINATEPYLSNPTYYTTTCYNVVTLPTSLQTWGFLFATIVSLPPTAPASGSALSNYTWAGGTNINPTGVVADSSDNIYCTGRQSGVGAVVWRHTSASAMDIPWKKSYANSRLSQYTYLNIIEIGNYVYVLTTGIYYLYQIDKSNGSLVKALYINLNGSDTRSNLVGQLGKSDDGNILLNLGNYQGSPDTLFFFCKLKADLSQTGSWTSQGNTINISDATATITVSDVAIGTKSSGTTTLTTQATTTNTGTPTYTSSSATTTSTTTI